MIIGITGNMGAGKTTIANILQKHNYTEYAMAEPIKQIAKIVGFTNKQLYGTQDDKLEINDTVGMSARHFLQYMGTDVFRELNTDIWVNIFKNKYLNEPFDILSGPKKYVISDVRFLNEANMIKKLGGIIIRVFRENDNTAAHVSETELHNIKHDYIINNTNLSLSELETEVNIILKVINMF